MIRWIEAASVGSPLGRLYHVAASDGTSVRVVDVWESPPATRQAQNTIGG